MFIHDAPNRERVTSLWAWMSRDDDGREGIIAAPLPGIGTMPLVFAYRSTADRLEPLARLACAAVNPDKTPHLIEFRRVDE